MNNYANGMILIPTYQPKENLLEILVEIRSEIVSIDEYAKNLDSILIIVVNDGSTVSGADNIFKEIEKQNNVVLINHLENKGKGAALKTGIQYALKNNAEFLVTADADGQHLPRDIVKVFKHPVEDNLVIGSRKFYKDVPLRSRFGNILTSILFKNIFRIKISDTQSGLRKFSNASFKKYLSIEADGYQFEMEALILSSKHASIIEVPIETVYEPGNPTSHFDPIWDSAQIYFVLFRGMVSSLLITFFDIALFSMLVGIDVNTFIAILISRSISTILYFDLGKKFIFKSNGDRTKEFLKFVTLVVINAIILTPAIEYFATNSEFNKPVIYATGSTLLFLLNFGVQKFFVFQNGKKDG